MFPSISIIIPVKKNNPFLEECLNSCLNLDYPFFEIIILPDEMIGVYSDSRINVLPTGEVLPASKRDIGSNNANGQILAFIDDDTYPDKDWLKQAVLNFADESVACVGGPAVTAENEPFLNKASGKILESFIVTGPARFRYLPLKRRVTDDFPSCNFLIRRDIFQQLGGFKTKFWPGEDTVLCLEIVHRLRKKILYDPLVKVYHHRRPLFKKYLKQIANYALHRGYFVKRFSKTSFKIGYFLPSIVVFVILLSIIAGIILNIKFFIIPFVYLLTVLFFSFDFNPRLSLYIFLGTILTHFAYGINFIKGIFSKKLEEE